MGSSRHQLLRGLACGDLHLLAGRQRYFRSEDWRRHWREELDLCVLNGDVFDFRWATTVHPREALRQAEEWLEALVAPPVRARFLIIMGNHDALPEYRDFLFDLSARHAHVEGAEHWARVGDKVFFHGDFPDDSGALERLRHARRRHGQQRRPGRGRRGLYWMATHAGLTGSLPRAFPWRRQCVRSDRFLAAEMGTSYETVREVFLAHTHVHFQDLQLGSRLFHNAGTPLRGAAFRPLPFTFAECEWEARETR